MLRLDRISFYTRKINVFPQIFHSLNKKTYICTPEAWCPRVGETFTDLHSFISNL